ncbi:RsfA family transcriptional regulator [Litchfieldia alkalitelluris]|uniref:RsfA family transcriptional regulator n=1 Tax=Litchfieldia alkalitelluris TaxID=304268 RepID=UPI003AF31D9E
MDSLVRQDAWNQDEDLLLAEVVLRHIREGSTQLSAFEEVGEKLSRTPAACGFRWNSSIRKKYESAIQLAKKQRKQLKLKDIESDGGPTQITLDSDLQVDTDNPLVETIDEMVEWLLEKKREINENGHNNGHASEEFKVLVEKNAQLENELSRLRHEYEIVKNDYQLMINVMERATKRNENTLSSK